MTGKGPRAACSIIMAVAYLLGVLSAAMAAASPSETVPSDQIKWTAPDQETAKKRAYETVPFVSSVLEECQLCRQQRLRDKGLSVKDQPESYFLLDSPIIKSVEDQYGPVRFMHSKHAGITKDCALCHHYRPLEETALETTRCSACHQDAFNPDHPDRIGLKAAYHQQCMGCHQDRAKGPVDCIGCHVKNVPDHSKMVKLPDKPEPSQVTSECLRCHQPAGEDMLASAHWLWKGPSPYTLDHRKDVKHGKASTAVNNF